MSVCFVASGVYLSYKRVDSAAAVLQLHEALGSFGFDVFLDTFDVRPGEDFQAILWHRLCDSDVMIIPDTPGLLRRALDCRRRSVALSRRRSLFSVSSGRRTSPNVSRRCGSPFFSINPICLVLTDH